MHQSSRQGKFHAKLQLKIKDQSSLPEIDPFHGNPPKYTPTIIYKPKNAKQTIKKTNERNQDFFSSTRTHIRSRDIEPYVNTYKILSDQQSEPTITKTNYQKKHSIEAQKQLMTADTIRPQHKYQNISSQNKQLLTQGLDMWILNNNLKQFSETRKLPFYKMRHENKQTNQRTSAQMHKTKTQDIKSMYKIYGGGEMRINHNEKQQSEGQSNYKKLAEPIKKTKLAQKDAKSHTTINPKLTSPLGNTLYGTLPVRKHHSNLDKTFYKNQCSQSSLVQEVAMTNREVNPYLRTFINGSHLKRDSSNRNIHILEMGSFGMREKKDEIRAGNIRRNRFEMVQQQKEQIQGETLRDKLPSKSLHSPTGTSPLPNDEQTSSMASQPHSPQVLTSSLPSSLPVHEQKKKHYEYLRSIERINKSLLKHSENYVEQYHMFSSLPNSKIEFYVDSLNHPEVGTNTLQYKSTFKGEVWEEAYDAFAFMEKRSAGNKEKDKKKQSSGKGKQNISRNKILS